jgi:hypothetical protein
MEASKAALVLQVSEYPRTAWTVARAAFEAMHDLVYLLVFSDSPLLAGARVYVGALDATARTRGALNRAAAAADLDLPRQDEVALRSFVREEAQGIERISPGSEAAILAALEERLKGGQRHWSRLSRTDMNARIRKRYFEAKGLGPMLDAYYAALSVNAHPRLRIGQAVSIEGGAIRYRPAPDPPDATPCSIAVASIRMTEAVLDDPGRRMGLTTAEEDG